MVMGWWKSRVWGGGDGQDKTKVKLAIMMIIMEVLGVVMGGGGGSKVVVGHYYV